MNRVVRWFYEKTAGMSPQKSPILNQENRRQKDQEKPRSYEKHRPRKR